MNSSPAYGRRSAQQSKAVEEQPTTRLCIAKIVIQQLRKAIIAREGCDGIAKIAMRFKIMDSTEGQKDRRLTALEMYKGLKQVQIEISRQDAQIVLNAIDTNGSGDVCFDEFIFAIRGSLNPTRLAVVDKAFDMFDSNKDGNVSFEECKAKYDVSEHPDVKAGRITEEQAMETFMHSFQANSEGKSDKTISREEFRDYFKSVSACIDTDEYFTFVVTNAWHLYTEPKKGEMAVNTSNLRVLVQFVDGTSKVVCVKNDLGIARNDVKAIKCQLYKEGVYQISKIQVCA